jgi:succinoglycan biosynthesis protein ExoL
MKKVVFLLSHIPNPRILKRVKVLENDFKISLIYWDRNQTVKETFEISQKHKVEQISISAPQGKPLKRIIPWLKFFYKSIKILRLEAPSVVHVNNLDMLLIAIFYKSILSKNTKIVYEVADLPKYTFVKEPKTLKSIVSLIMQGIEKRITTKIEKIILTSPYFWDEYYSKFLDEKKYIFMPNAPLMSIFSKYRKKTHDRFTIGFIGSVRFVDQLKMLIDAVEELENNINILIAGSGPGYTEIRDYSRNKEFVEIYGPYNYEKEIVNLYEKVDCVYSLYDTRLNNIKIALPNRLYESIVCGIPIIGAKNTVLGKFIEDNQIGFAIDENKKELKEILSKLSSSKELKKVITSNCDGIKSNYYFEKNGEKLLAEYKSLNAVQ